MKVVNYCLLLPAAIAQEMGAAIYGGAGVYGDTSIARFPYPGGGGGGGGVACTMEAKICPDGRSVGRSGPNCEFDCGSGGGGSWNPSNPWNPNPWNPTYPTWPTYPTNPWPTYPSDPYNPWPSYPSNPWNPTYPTWPTYPTNPSWPSTPTYPGMAACWSHNQCGRGQYCYSCSQCSSTPGCPMTSTCRSNPNGGECAVLANCERDRDAIDGVCPGSGGGGGGGGTSVCAAVLCAPGERCVPSPKQCMRAPCPQYSCEPWGGGGGSNPCQPNPCKWNEQCIRLNIQCLWGPCDRDYQCIPSIGGGGGGGGQCGANEVYESCGSSSCWEQKCPDSGPWPPQVCTMDCRSGCKCKPGFKRLNGQCTEFCYVLGRPYSTDKGFLVAPVLSTPSLYTTVSSSASETNASDPLFANVLSADQLSKAANYWAKVAMMEHASVASFSRFSLELMSVGASPELLALAHQAALDEVRHTQVSLDIANQFSSTTFSPGAFPISSKAADFAFGDMEKIASAAALEACIEETLAAAVVLYQADHMGDSNHKTVLRAVALDEANHAAFAWRAVQWMASTSPAVHAAVSAVFSERAAQYKVAPQEGSVPALESLGLLDQGTIAKVQHVAWHQVVVPAAVSLGFLSSSEASHTNAGGAQPVADVIARALASCKQTPVA